MDKPIKNELKRGISKFKMITCNQIAAIAPSIRITIYQMYEFLR
jgi:hypothetical protein